VTEDHGKLRISNADRELAIAQLQAALDEGRIDLVEFDERAKTAYEAKTNAELDLIFDDLPGGRPKEGEVVPAGPAAATAKTERAPRTRNWLHDVPALRALVLVGGICTLIWLAGAISSGNYGGFWPIWPIMGLSIATFVQLVNPGRGGDDAEDDEDDGPRRERRGHDWH
jgi:hypothetical protein